MVISRRRSALVVATVLVVATGVIVGVLLGRDRGIERGPLHFNPATGLTGEGLVTPPHATLAYTVHGALSGSEPAIIDSVRILSVAGYPTQRLTRAALLTGLGEGMWHGWPENNPDFKNSRLIGNPIKPSDNIRILIGVNVGDKKFYAAAGLEVDYTVSGHHYRTQLYDALATCVGSPNGACRHYNDAGSDQERAAKIVQQMAGLD